ncbi:MAG: Rha family transcriptional regulator [Fusobacterium ulcerans]|uniref:Rha family transcriptional regulator n=1 Tax=Fusobacterium ulcerans TaxID=861 RepID=UPI003A8C182E
MNEVLEYDEKIGYYITSRTIAEGMGKRHDNIVRAIDKILTNGNVRSLNSTNSNVRALFILSEYRDKKGELRREYKLTKDGFTLYMFHVQGFTEFKMAYINRFNEMESFIKEAHTKLKEIKIDKKFDWMDKRVRDRLDRTGYIEDMIAYLYEILDKEYEKIEEDIKFKKDSVSKFFLDFKTSEKYDASKEKLPIIVEYEIEEELAEKINNSKMTNKEILEKTVNILEQKKLTTKE